jgi:cellulose biosynthesis protein BcsQ
MKVISFFNNKGGVGKTTLTGNIAAYFAFQMKKRMLVIDCHPQCNVTQFIIGDSRSIDLYWPSKSDKDETKSKTILDLVQPILDGDAGINRGIKTITSRTNRFGVDLLPGHPRFSLMEDPLSLAWTELPSGKPGGGLPTGSQVVCGAVTPQSGGAVPCIWSVAPCSFRQPRQGAVLRFATPPSG